MVDDLGILHAHYPQHNVGYGVAAEVVRPPGSFHDRLTGAY